MGELKNQFFLQHINKSLENVRQEFIDKYRSKKENRFYVKGITYDIGNCSIDAEHFVFQISSKIPQDLLPLKVKIERYFRSVVRIMNKASRKPAESKMENIVHNTSELEFKERDYVKLSYRYAESELYNYADVEKRLKHHRAKGTPIPAIPGVATISGRLVIILVEEFVTDSIKRIVSEFIKANEAVKLDLKAHAPPPLKRRKPSAPAKKPKKKATTKKAPTSKKTTAKKKKGVVKKKPTATRSSKKTTGKRK